MKLFLIIFIIPTICIGQLKIIKSESPVTIATAYFNQTKIPVASISWQVLLGKDTSYRLTFLKGEFDHYLHTYTGFAFTGRNNMKQFIQLLITVLKKHDLKEEYHLKSDDGKSLLVYWLGKELIVMVNPEYGNSTYMRCLKTTIDKLNVL